MRTAIIGVVLAFCASYLPPAQGQIYHFEDEPLPLNKSLRTLYAFYVYSQDDAPGGVVGAPFAKFHGLVAHPASGAVTVPLQAYMGLQLHLIKYSDFWKLVDKHKFCTTLEDVEANPLSNVDQLLIQRKAVPDAEVHSHTVRFQDTASAPTRDMKKGVSKTGVYILIFSNCGDLTGGTVSGTVIVKNAYGFLPGNEYHKMPFYGWLLLVYMVLAIGWMVLSIRWWKELFSIQNCIAAVILFGLVESFLWYIFYNDWNSNGTRGKFVFVMAILFTVVKSTYSYMLVLVAALGWGVTRPFLDKQVILKIQLMSGLYIVLDFIRETVLSFRHSHSLSLPFVLLCLLPVSLLNGAIFYWVFTALSSLMETLQERRQTEKLLLFQRLWKVLIFALSVATFTLLWQIFNLSRSITARWRSQWMFGDGVSHILFLIVLTVMMYLWAPHKNSQRYTYSNQLDGCDDDRDKVPQATWVDEDGLEEDDDDGESFWATTQAHRGGAVPSKDADGVQAEVVGASSSQDRDCMEL